MNRRPVPARVQAVQERRRSNAAGTHRQRPSRQESQRRALREQGWVR